jgi:hypothetical protein
LTALCSETRPNAKPENVTGHLEKMNLIRRIDTGINLLFLGIALLTVIVIPIDIYDFLTDPSEYVMVYHLDTTKRFWQWDYLQGDVLLLVFIIISLYIGIKKLKHGIDNKKWNIIFYIIITFVIIFAGLGYYEWYLTGFDH